MRSRSAPSNANAGFLRKVNANVRTQVCNLCNQTCQIFLLLSTTFKHTFTKTNCYVNFISLLANCNSVFGNLFTDITVSAIVSFLRTSI